MKPSHLTVPPELFDGIIIDNFAGGGGASSALEEALGRHVDIAINHDAKALAMHAANHPYTRHIQEDMFAADPFEVCAGRPIDIAWFSPDCTDFSQAKGGKPLRKEIRALCHVVIRWASLPAWQRPQLIFLENVREFLDYGPLDAEGRRIKARKGELFQRWVARLRKRGYVVEWTLLRACDYGAGTKRLRLFLVARCDGRPISFPKITHWDPKAARPPQIRVKLAPWVPAAASIDFSLPCPSIFDRKRPLKDNTMRRIALGVWRYTINSGDPFIVPITHTGAPRVHDIREPLRTITCANRGELALVQPSIVSVAHGDSGGRREYSAEEPIGTLTARGRTHALVSAFLAQYNNNPNGTVNEGHSLGEPMSTIATRGPHQALATAHLVSLKGTDRRDQSMLEPVPAITAGGWHLAEVRAFLLKYYGTGAIGSSLNAPLHTITTLPRFGLVMVKGVAYEIYDIGFRMLTPRELFKAQGFRAGYKIDVVHEGKKLTISDQVEKVGNSVSPPPAIALIKCNMPIGPRRVARPEKLAA